MKVECWWNVGSVGEIKTVICKQSISPLPTPQAPPPPPKCLQENSSSSGLHLGILAGKASPDLGMAARPGSIFSSEAHSPSFQLEGTQVD
jgi:hypothetical protein